MLTDGKCAGGVVDEKYFFLNFGVYQSLPPLRDDPPPLLTYVQAVHA
jgi:hypothetical protein